LAMLNKFVGVSITLGFVAVFAARHHVIPIVALSAVQTVQTIVLPVPVGSFIRNLLWFAPTVETDLLSEELDLILTQIKHKVTRLSITL